jgi:hypothetical protein
MFKKPKPHGLNGLAEILQSAEDSKVQRNKATRSLIVELEKRRREQEAITGDEQIKTWRKFGAI